MTNITSIIKPWEMGEVFKRNDIPTIVTADCVLAKIVPPKDKATGGPGSVRNGLVATFIMIGYTDEAGNTIETIKYSESPEGYKFEFPLGKKELVGTKFRGPKNYYRFFNLESKEFYNIPQEKFTVEYAEKFLSEKISGWNNIPDNEKDLAVDEYLSDMFLYGLSQDLVLPIKDGNFEKPFVGLQTKLYRVHTPAQEGEKWGKTILTKWQKGLPSLDGTYNTMSEELATAMLLDYQTKDDKVTTDFDPTTFTEDTADDVI